MNILKVRKRKGERTEREREKGKEKTWDTFEGRKEEMEGGRGNETQYGMHFNLSLHLPSSGPGISCWPSVLAIPTSKQHHTCTTRPHIIPGMSRSLSASDPCNCLNLVTEQQEESWKSLRQGSGVWG